MPLDDYPEANTINPNRLSLRGWKTKPGFPFIFVQRMVRGCLDRGRGNMTKRCFGAGILLVMALVGCSSADPGRPAAQEKRDTPSVTPTLTLSPVPSDTPIPPSPSFLPSATQPPAPSPVPTDTVAAPPMPDIWPTPTPGVPPKRTPSARETCPEHTRQSVSFEYHLSLDEYLPGILSYLLQNGISPNSASSLQSELSKIEIQGIMNPGGPLLSPLHLEAIVLSQDLTGDGQAELVVLLSQLKEIVFYNMGLYILGCQAGGYQTLYQEGYPGWGYTSAKTDDWNADGLRELLVEYTGEMAPPVQHYRMLEWDGRIFRDVLSGGLWTAGMSSLVARDVDGNGTLELIAAHPYMGHGAGQLCDTGPFLSDHDTYMWLDGRFRFLRTEYDPPVYRFQSALIGDNYTFYGLYEKAKYWYERAIDDANLKPASRAQLEQDGYFSSCPEGGDPDPGEPERVRAYAAYRWMILEAHFTYAASVQRLWGEIAYEFPESDPGYPFTRMALVFWQEYQATKDAGLACQKVRSWLPGHEMEIFSNFYDYHSNLPEPDSVSICPF